MKQDPIFTKEYEGKWIALDEERNVLGFSDTLKEIHDKFGTNASYTKGLGEIDSFCPTVFVQ